MRSSANRITHGLNSVRLRLATDDVEEYRRHPDEGIQSLGPATGAEHQIVQLIADLTWRLKRVERIEQRRALAILGDLVEQTPEGATRARAHDLVLGLDTVARMVTWSPLPVPTDRQEAPSRPPGAPGARPPARGLAGAARQGRVALAGGGVAPGGGLHPPERAPPLLLAIPDAAAALGVSISTLRRRIRLGEVPVKRIGRSVRVDIAVLRPAPEADVARLAAAARGPRRAPATPPA